MTSEGQPVRQRLRLRYRKDEVLMYTGHLDLLRLLVRWLRRAEVPFGTSGKFSPKPRITFGPVLPLGVLGENELLDLELAEGLWLDQAGLAGLLARLQSVSAPRDFARGLQELLPEAPPIHKAATIACYRLECADETGATSVLEFLQNADLSYMNPKGLPRDDRQALIEMQAKDSGVDVWAHCSGDPQLNILRLARKSEASGAAQVMRCTRVCLASSLGQPL